jgi:hypothetical protein
MAEDVTRWITVGGKRVPLSRRKLPSHEELTDIDKEWDNLSTAEKKQVLDMLKENAARQHKETVERG